MKSLTFQLALIEAILTQPAEFSIHDITKTIRKNLRDQKYDLIDIDDRMDYLDFEVPVVAHDDVKRTFDIIENSGILSLLGYELKDHKAYRLYGKVYKSQDFDDEDLNLQNAATVGATKGALKHLQPFSLCKFIELGDKKSPPNLADDSPFPNSKKNEDGQFEAEPELVNKIEETVEKWLDNGEEVTLRRICNSIQVKGLGIYEMRCLLENPLNFDIEVKEPFYKSIVTEPEISSSW